VASARHGENPRFSVVVPIYDESRRLERPVATLVSHLARIGESAELVFVDDGSRDGTFERIQSLVKEAAIPVRVLRYERNRGKGHALKVGFANTRGQRILFSDVDLATPIDALASLSEAMDRGYDIAIGSRIAEGAEILVHQPWYRKQMGRVFTWLVRVLFADVSDATCGFKMFRGEMGRELFSHLRIDGWAFDAELLFLARRRGLRIVEVPVRWEDRSGSKVHLLRDSLGSLLELIRIVSNQWRGRYAEPREARPELRIWSNEAGQARGREGADADPGAGGAPRRRVELAGR
jgi:dolichyl-phosphate beta-glucosyltransferase